MAIDCTGNLTADITFDCINAPIGGIEQNVVLINKDDIDITATTIDAANRLQVTGIQLKPGKKGYKLTGIKQANGKAWELVKKKTRPTNLNTLLAV